MLIHKIFIDASESPVPMYALQLNRAEIIFVDRIYFPSAVQSRVAVVRLPMNYFVRIGFRSYHFSVALL